MRKLQASAIGFVVFVLLLPIDPWFDQGANMHGLTCVNTKHDLYWYNDDIFPFKCN